jgi:hypothetical protein
VAIEVTKRLPSSEYHSRLDWLSSSMFKTYLSDPREYEARYITRTLPGERSSAMDIGTVGHAAILEPHVITDTCREIPQDALSANGARSGKAWQQFVAENAGMVLLKAEELASIRGMFDSVYNHPIAKRLLLSDGECEASIFWDCGLSGIKRRCRPDKIVDSWGWVDIKTTTAGVDPESFRRTVRTYRYDIQQEFYRDAGVRLYGERPRYVFVLVSQVKPWPVRVYDLGEQFVENARNQIETGLLDIARRQQSGDWSNECEREIKTIN